MSDKAAGQVHDLGYKRYAGIRRSAATRWIVIMRNLLATSWQTWWRFKIWLLAAVMATAISTAFLYLASSKLMQMLGGVGGHAVKIADGILPLSTIWYCKIGFAVSLSIGATVVAADAQSGAFTFYFARSVEARDYVLGKLAGLLALLALIMLAGPLLLAGMRLGLSNSVDQLIEFLPILPKALAIGALGTLVYAAVPLGFSAIVANRGYAIAMWAAYDVLIGSMALRLGGFGHPAIAALDLPSSLQAVSFALFDVQLRTGPDIPLGAALISIFGQSALALAVVYFRVKRAHGSGIGGAS